MVAAQDLFLRPLLPRFLAGGSSHSQILNAVILETIQSWLSFEILPVKVMSLVLNCGLVKYEKPSSLVRIRYLTVHGFTCGLCSA